MKINMIYSYLCLSTEGYKFENGLDVILGNYQKKIIERDKYFLIEQEKKLRETLHNEDYPLGEFLNDLHENNDSISPITIVYLKNMMLRVIKDENVKVNEYLTENNTFTEQANDYFHSIFINITEPLLTEKERETQITGTIKDITKNVNSLMIQLNKSANTAFLSHILSKPYQQEYDLNYDNKYLQKPKIKLK